MKSEEQLVDTLTEAISYKNFYNSFVKLDIRKPIWERVLAWIVTGEILETNLNIFNQKSTFILAMQIWIPSIKDQHLF